MGNWLRAEAFLDCGNKKRNKALIDTFIAEADHWNQPMGADLAYERLNDKRACRIAAYRNDVDLDDPAARAALMDWAASTLDRMFTAMNEPLRTRAAELRSLDTGPDEGADPE